MPAHAHDDPDDDDTRHGRSAAGPPPRERRKHMHRRGSAAVPQWSQQLRPSLVCLVRDDGDDLEVLVEGEDVAHVERGALVDDDLDVGVRLTVRVRVNRVRVRV